MDRDPIMALDNYIKALEEVNKSLLDNLKICVMLLDQFSDVVPDPKGWKQMIDMFEDTIALAEQHEKPSIYH